MKRLGSRVKSSVAREYEKLPRSAKLCISFPCSRRVTDHAGWVAEGPHQLGSASKPARHASCTSSALCEYIPASTAHLWCMM